MGVSHYYIYDITALCTCALLFKNATDGNSFKFGTICMYVLFCQFMMYIQKSHFRRYNKLLSPGVYIKILFALFYIYIIIAK